MSAHYHLDFVRARRPAGIGGIMLLLVGIAALAGILGYDAAYLRPPLAAAQLKLDDGKQALAARHPEMPKSDLARFESDRQEVDKASATINRPWKALFETLETLADRPVALLQFEPDVVKGEVTLAAEAKDLEEMSAYYRDIQHLANFSDVVLRTHQTNFQDPDKPVRFRLALKWKTQP